MTRSFVALAAADHDLVGGEVNILDAEPAALEHPEPGAVEQAGHEVRHTVEPLEHPAHLCPREYHGEPHGALRAHDAVQPRQIDLQHLLVEEQEGAQGLVLGRGGDLPIDRERREELRDFRGAHLGGGALVVEDDETPDPGDVRLLSATAEVTGSQGLADAVEETGLWGLGRVALSARPRSAAITAGWQRRILA